MLNDRLLFALCTSGIQNPEILESALRVFQGRAAYTGPLGRDSLAPLVSRYGLVLI